MNDGGGIKKANHKLLGWSLNPTATASIYQSAESFTRIFPQVIDHSLGASLVIKSNIDLYAIWQPINSGGFNNNNNNNNSTDIEQNSNNAKYLGNLTTGTKTGDDALPICATSLLVVLICVLWCTIRRRWELL